MPRKENNMTKGKSNTRWIVLGGIIVLAVVVLLAFKFFPWKTPDIDTPPEATVADSSVIKVPVGETSFPVDIEVNEDEAYAGIEFALTLSDEDALQYVSFKPLPEGATASPFVTKNDLHYFGFYTGSNAFPAGLTPAGILSFDGYTSDKDLTVTVVQMKVTRLDENKKSVTTVKDSPAYTFTIEREK